jgi:site-specific recombinase XerD
LALLRWIFVTDRDFPKFTDKDIFKWIESQREINAQPASINRRICTCYMFFRYAFGRSVSRANETLYGREPSYRRRSQQFQGIPNRRSYGERGLKVKNPQRMVQILAAEEVKKFLETTSRYRDVSIILLMLFCGLRSCEVLSLKLTELDLESQRLRVIGKGDKERILPFPQRLGDALRRYIRYERPVDSESCQLFVVLQGNRLGQSMTRAGLRRLFRYKREITGISRARAHVFRHSFGTNMARQGVGLPVLQKMMGHANFKITLRYINLAMDDIATEYERTIAKIERYYDET